MKISVYIPSFNQRELLIEAIESVLAQTLRPQQIILIDGCSHDGSQDVIAGYAAQYPDWITPLYHDRNYGIAQTRTNALQAVTGDYVTYVDGDDYFLPTKLEQEAAALQDNPQVEGVFSDYYFLNSAGERLYRWADAEQPPEGDLLLPIFGRDLPRRTLFRSALVDIKCWQAAGFFDPNLHIYEDWEARIRLARHCRFVYVAEPLSAYRRSRQGLSSAPVAEHVAVSDYIMNKHRPLLEQFTAQEQRQIKNNLNQWRGHLYRHAARGELWKAAPGFRRRVLRHYLHSLRYQRVLDLRLLAALFYPFRRKAQSDQKPSNAKHEDI